jgi:hypothetical protein
VTGDEHNPEEEALDSARLLTVLTTEHFALQGTRAVVTSEAISRASLYVATLSSGLVAVGFAGSRSFLGYFLAAIIPLVAIVGVVTFIRLVSLSVDDLRLMREIERIHAYYRRLAPDASSLFPPVDTSDLNALLAFSGRRASALQIFSSAAAMVALLNTAVIAAGVTLALSAGSGRLTILAALGGVVALLVSAFVSFRFLYRSTSRALLHRSDFELPIGAGR